jgi:beta-N-acetylhexosaminidase
MASHARYPALDPDHIASQSPAILGRLLRGRLGFRGAVITDSLEARAVLARSSVATAAIRSLRAGADLVLLTGPGSYPSVYRRLLALARRSRPFRARLQAAYARARTVIGSP